VVYTRDTANGTDSTALDVFIQRITGPGILLAEHAIDVTSNEQSNPSVAAYRLNTSTPYLVANADYWNDSLGDVRAYLVDSDGQSVTLANIADTNGRQELDPGVASSEVLGGYTVV